MPPSTRPLAAAALPEPGPNVPRRNYGIWSRAGAAWMRWRGWRIEGELPDVARVVIAVAPHSSNWDFVHAIAAVFALRLRVSFVGKHTLFRGALGRFMTWLGGIPVDRTRPNGLADTLRERFAQGDALWIGVAPEGTRRRDATFKSGFYRIAQAANVPIVPVFLNYERQVIGVMAPQLPHLPADEGVAAIRALLLEHGRRRQ